MNANARIIMFLALAIFLASAAYYVGKLRSDQRLDELSQRLDSMQHRQKIMMDAYLTGSRQSRDELARSSGYHRVALPRHERARAGENDHPQSPQERLRQAQNLRNKLQNDFTSEPLDAKWSGTTMQKVQDAIVDIAANGGPTPQAAKIDCRSSTCHIELGLLNNVEIGQLMEPLLMEIFTSLPNAKIVEIPSSDDHGVVLHVYASKG